MNKTLKIQLAVKGALVGYCLFEYVKIVKEERAKRKEMQSKLDRHLLALTSSSMKIEKRIKEGYYDRRSIDELLTDIDFEFIIAQES